MSFLFRARRARVASSVVCALALCAATARASARRSIQVDDPAHPGAPATAQSGDASKLGLFVPARRSSSARGADDPIVLRQSNDPRPATGEVSESVHPRSPAPLGGFRFDYSAACDESSFESMIEYLGQVFPDLFRAQSLGETAQGRRIWLLSVGDSRETSIDEKPAVFVSSSLGAREDAAPAGPTPVLFALESLLWNARTDAETERMLARSTLYFVPAPDPDGVFGAAERDLGWHDRRVRLARNFPWGWHPWGRGAFANGPYPLSEPESRAIARFLDARTNVGAVVLLGTAEAAISGAASSAEPSSSVDASPGGSLERFCQEALGARVYSRDLRRNPLIDTPLGPAPADFERALALVVESAAAFPVLEARVHGKERLQTELWLVDLTLTNTGTSSTRRSANAKGRSAPSVWVRASGAHVNAMAIKPRGEVVFEPVAGAGPARDVYLLDELDAGASVELRVVVSAAQAATLALDFESLRAGRTHVSIPLP